MDYKVEVFFIVYKYYIGYWDFCVILLSEKDEVLINNYNIRFVY